MGVKTKFRGAKRVLVMLLLLGIVFPSFVCTSAHGYSHQTNWLFHQIEDLATSIDAFDHDHEHKHDDEGGPSHNHNESPDPHDHNYSDSFGLEVGNVSHFKKLDPPIVLLTPDFDLSHPMVETVETSPSLFEVPNDPLHMRRSTVLIV